MSIRFAPARTPARLIGWHAQGRGLVWAARHHCANDNGETIVRGLAFDPLLTNALKHFAVHGLGSVEAALNEAEDARAQGDVNAKDHWLAITQMFDRRRAATASGAPSRA